MGPEPLEKANMNSEKKSATNIELPEWLIQLRREKITIRVHNDPRTDQPHEKFLGISKDDVQQAIEYGQADFDEPAGALSPEDKVLLYAYFNQRRHLEELFAAFSEIFPESGATAHPEDPIVVDLGCGPFTGGLALASVLGKSEKMDYIGVDLSQTMLNLGKELAEASGCYGTHQWFSSIASIAWERPKGWRDVIVIVSFLFGGIKHDSECDQLVSDLRQLLTKLGCGSVMILYTNSDKTEPNAQFDRFKHALENLGFSVHADASDAVTVPRGLGTRTLRLRYALLHRNMQEPFRHEDT